ncbi:sugar transferase [Metabacillus indicus]|uniref:sugar transferase n=1 Tax=Metabacillus indicus TaxID=246786 RepID=UPI002A02C4EA|nr:sugar transferase [Metabacillus indicus]MDX8289235.1 sugar transferase [Metabacillus indicus]
MFMRRSDRSSFWILLMILDLFVVYGSYELSYHLLQNGLSIETAIEIDAVFLLFLAAASIISFQAFDLHIDWKRHSARNLLYSIVLSSLTLNVLVVSMNAITGTSLTVLFLIIAFLSQVAVLCCSKLVMWSYLRNTHSGKKVLVIGKTPEISSVMAQKFMKQRTDWLIMSDFLSAEEKEKYEEKMESADVVLIGPEVSKQDAAIITGLSMKKNKEVMIVPDLFELFIANSRPEQIDDLMVFSIKPPELSRTQTAIKRMTDIAVSLLLIAAAGPIMSVLYLLIPLTSKGAAVFKQERIGLFGKPYMLYKFRSMVQDAEMHTGPVLASDRDPRITYLGNIIRATRLDELPQLFNVLKGDMSLIGPRPEREFFIRKFEVDFPDYHHRLRVKPGITGLAQVLANYTTEPEDKLRYDLMYVRNYSVMLDLKILLQTIRVIIQRDQAQGVSVDLGNKNEKAVKPIEQSGAVNQ